MLRVDHVGVRFGGAVALDDVSLAAEPGAVTGVIGPNGAGKTTLFNVITGLQAARSGSVYFGDRDVGSLPAHKRARLGLARTFQSVEVFGSLTVRDNVLVAAEIRRRWSGDRSDPHQICDEILHRVAIADIAEERVDAMPTGVVRLVEVARALATKPKLLLLDEVGAGLDESSSLALGDLLVDLASTGMAVLLVEHDVELVMRLCSKIFVLHLGAVIACGGPAEIQLHEAVQQAYLGPASR